MSAMWEAARHIRGVLGDRVLGVFVAGVAVAVLVRAGSVLVIRRALDKRRHDKQQQTRRSIETLRERLLQHPSTVEEIERIEKLSLAALVDALKTHQVTPLQVLRVYQLKALQAHDRTNCLIEVVTEAEEWAIAAEAGPREGLLFGIPISIKEDVVIKGYDVTLGCAGLIGIPAPDDCAFLKVLKQQGAIPFVRTNLPQLAFSFEPGNPIYGIVRNPYNLAHGPGGSSSGEAALVASRASILGFGSDIGGSLRVPAHFTGICTLKPTVQRMSNVGEMEDFALEQKEIESVYGPLTTTVDDLVVALTAVWDGSLLSKLDPVCPPMPFNKQVYESQQKLRIGCYTDNGVFPSFPGCHRAVIAAKNTLQENGHEVIQWDLPGWDEVSVFMYRLLMVQGISSVDLLIKYDCLDPSLKYMFRPMVPYWCRWLIAKFMRHLLPDLSLHAEYTLGIKNIGSV